MANKNVTISPNLDIAGLVIEEVQKTIDRNKEQAYRNLVNNIKKIQTNLSLTNMVI